MGYKSFVRHVADEGLPTALLMGANLTLLSVFAMAHKVEPHIGIWICQWIFPAGLLEGPAQAYVAYRMSLYAVASAISLCLMLGVLVFGVREPTPGARNRPPRWLGMLLALLWVFVGWLGYPLLALSNLPVMVNDLGYFAMTVAFFWGGPLLMHSFSWRYGRARKMETIHQVRL